MDCSECLKISGKNNNTITKIESRSTYNNSAYANHWIPSNSNIITKWKIINHNCGIDNLLIGLINEKHHQNVDEDIDAEGCYLYCNGETLKKDGTGTGREGPFLSKGETAILTLDLKCNQIRIRILDDVDETEEVVLFDDVPTGSGIKYKLAVGIFRVNESVTISLDLKDE